jgi:hypothetical protein
VDDQLFTHIGIFRETGNIADPGDQSFRIIIRAVSPVPENPGIHFLV